MPLAVEFGCLLCIKETTADDRPCGSMGSGSDNRIKHCGFLAKFFQSAFCTPPAFNPVNNNVNKQLIKKVNNKLMKNVNKYHLPNVHEK